MFYQNHPKTTTRVLSTTLLLMLITVWGCGNSNNAGLLPVGDVVGPKLRAAKQAVSVAPDVIRMDWPAPPQQGVERIAGVFLPYNYDENSSETHPLMLVLHGAGQTARMFAERHPNLRAMAAARDVVLVFPQGVIEKNNGYRWNAFDNDINETNDVGFLEALIARLSAEYKIDANQIFISGFSNGGAMSQRFAAENPNDLVRAAASVCHTSGYLRRRDGEHIGLPVDPENRVPKGNVSMLLIRGGADNTIPSRGQKRNGKIYDTPKEQVEYWLDANGCDSSAFSPEIRENVPTSDSSVYDTISIREYNSCENNTVIRALYSKILTHDWFDAPNEIGIDMNQEVLDFFLDR